MTAHPAGSSADAIRTERLTKRYGERRGVFDLDLQVEQGEIFGFIGPNGAGKSTTLKLLMGLVRPDSGTGRILGHDVRREAARVHRDVGYLPGEFGLDPHLSGRQLLTYLGNLRGGVDPSEVQRLSTRLGLDLDRPFGEYSRGNKQKVGLVQAFMHRPRVLILDEPTDGLDPLNQVTVSELVQEAAADGAAVFFSSHVLGDVEALCRRVGVIREGRLLQVTGIHQLLEMRALRIKAECAQEPEADLIARIDGVSQVQVEGTTLRCAVRGDMDPLLRALAPYHICRLLSREPTLAEVFIGFYDGTDTGTS